MCGAVPYTKTVNVLLVLDGEYVAAQSWGSAPFKSQHAQ